jgi:hypothetical protein
LHRAGGRENISGNMSKGEDGNGADLELEATVASGLGGLFEDGDEVVIRTHSGGIFEGTIEDSNLAGVLLRQEDRRLFFVSFSGIEHAEIFEPEAAETDDDKTETEGPQTAAADAGAGGDVPPITGRAS